MAVIEKFLGQQVEIPEDRRYDPKQGLWGQAQDQDLVYGLTQPAVILAGGVNDLDWLVKDQVSVTVGQDVIIIITAKILYIHNPIKGTIFFNPEAKQNPSIISEDPYEKGWLFRIKPETDKEKLPRTLVAPQAYVESLKGTEGFKNPEGLKGGVSGMCKAVYSGIREQKF